MTYVNDQEINGRIEEIKRQTEKLVVAMTHMGECYRESEGHTITHLNNLYQFVDRLKQRTSETLQQISRYPEYFTNFTSWTERLVEDIQKTYMSLRTDCEKESRFVGTQLANLQQNISTLENHLTMFLNGTTHHPHYALGH